jgi:Holliday junction resolvasome RuvABC endonuclease subunit
MRVLGIDPGFSGGISLFEDGECIEAFPMPFYIADNEKKVINGKIIADYIKINSVDKAVIEFVHALPRDGSVSAFSFGKNTGIIIGSIQACGIPIIEIAPQKWKKLVLGEKYDHKDKKGTINFCKDSFPKINLLATKRSRIEHDGMADSIAIGHSYFLINKGI